MFMLNRTRWGLRLAQPGLYIQEGLFLCRDPSSPPYAPLYPKKRFYRYLSVTVGQGRAAPHVNRAAGVLRSKIEDG